MTRWLSVTVITACCSSACAAEVDGGEETDTGVTQAAISNGFVFSSEEYTGILALQYHSQTLQSWYTACTATLMTNKKAITAAHCVDPDPHGRQMYAKMGSQRIAVTGKWVHADWDVAVIKLAMPMKMWNWNNNAYLTTPRQVTTTGYGRAAYDGTNASLDGATMMCLGHGGLSASLPQPPLSYAFMRSGFGDGMQPLNQLHTYRTSLNQLQEDGDSGGPCLTGSSTIGSKLAYVQSGCFPPADFCYGTGAESWAGWAYWVLVAP